MAVFDTLILPLLNSPKIYVAENKNFDIVKKHSSFLMVYYLHHTMFIFCTTNGLHCNRYNSLPRPLHSLKIWAYGRSLWMQVPSNFCCNKAIIRQPYFLCKFVHQFIKFVKFVMAVKRQSILHKNCYLTVNFLLDLLGLKK